MKIVKHNHHLNGLAVLFGDQPDLSRMVSAAIKVARRTELQLEQERAKARHLEHRLEGLRCRHENDLARMAGMVSPHGACDFTDPKPDLSAPVPLVLGRAKDGDTPNLWACPKCGQMHARQIWAEDCRSGHAPRPCFCGKEIRYDSSSKCEGCQTTNRLRKAARISADDYTGWVNSDHLSGYSDGYFEDVSAFREAWEDAADDERPAEMPCYVWACTEDVWDGIDLERALENEMEDRHEDAADHLVDEKELWEFVETWNKKQHIVSYMVDHSRVVVIDQVRFDALIGGEGGEQ